MEARTKSKSRQPLAPSKRQSIEQIRIGLNLEVQPLQFSTKGQNNDVCLRNKVFLDCGVRKSQGVFLLVYCRNVTLDDQIQEILQNLYQKRKSKYAWSCTFNR